MNEKHATFLEVWRDLTGGPWVRTGPVDLKAEWISTYKGYPLISGEKAKELYALYMRTKFRPEVVIDFYDELGRDASHYPFIVSEWDYDDYQYGTVSIKCTTKAVHACEHCGHSEKVWPEWLNNLPDDHKPAV